MGDLQQFNHLAHTGLWRFIWVRTILAQFIRTKMNNTAKKVSPHYGVVLKGYSFRGSQYDNQQRIEAAVYYMVHGSLTKTAKACGIPLTRFVTGKNLRGGLN